ncbi:MAG: M20/M25/M40 family metallo-hydrolase [Marinicaulis sp.]|nr:M20/M25/M40 family metallo-hydrolase [Marinicaulis sp.]
MKVLISFFVIVLAAACATAPTNDTGAAAIAGNAADRIRADVAYLADDARRGREAGTLGYNDAAQYVADQMAAIGLTPVGDDGGWFQQVPLRSSVRNHDESKLIVTNADGSETILVNLDDYVIFPNSASVEPESAMEASGEAVFAGYGVHAPEFDHDDFAGLDVDGKIVVYFSGAPDSFHSEPRAHFGSSSNKRKHLEQIGAIGAVILRKSDSVKRSPWERQIANPASKSMTWIGPDGTADVSGPGVSVSAVLRQKKSEVLFAGAPKSFAAVLAEADAEGGAPKGFDLAVKVLLRGAVKNEMIDSPNVAGILAGADPELKDEVVVLTGHLDHIGVNQKLIDEGKDGINNGAMDNALGIATMLEAARALTAGERPARSIMFLAVTAEEKGLLGADYFVHFPTVARENIVANVNLDMPLVLYEFTDVIAFGAERSTLEPIVRAAAAEAGITLSPDPIPEQGLFTRSDHYRFVEKGVPSMFLVVGFANGGEEQFGEFLKNHYHKPSDEISLPILYDDAVRFADINMRIARGIANTENRPRWNEDDFFGDLFAGD